MLVFEERGNRIEKQQTQPTYGTESGNRTQATWVGGECSHPYAIPAPQVPEFLSIDGFHLTSQRPCWRTE